ncbi:hypothetical protein G7085_06635 [Tessaracoccus sp. HDW20]|uniref:hypothetical protein n=1 Tax=Tessaracoccus coleopterorum TaxID=2714950 RepID=UPI0018D45FD8|nr:hypothetical protein [Tessaracoccus coleopterorum]NHB84390.1 hypothetical protein [Tessaracoccus coleopterorum]
MVPPHQSRLGARHRLRHADARYWQTTTFIWDYSLSSWVHAQLDPAVMRRQILHWVGLDINSHFGTEWLTGGPVGYWYSVNQYALVRLVADYVRFTGDVAFLEVEVEGRDGSRRRMMRHVRDWALAWRDKRTPSGLADYGGIDNLLECVSTYIHEVASLQAANVWSMRTAAGLSRLLGETDEAAALEAEAEALLPKVLELYREGDGFFDARYPDGTRHATRHCYDFATVGTTIADDLPEAQRSEMVRFFETELRSPSWMRALSPRDADAGFSVRPDHQWNGAYPAWPADAGRSAIALGGRAGVMEWLEGLRRTTRQGPPGQAHFVEEAAPTVDGGARKAPGQFPYLIDWACSSAGAWCEFIVEGCWGRGRPRRCRHGDLAVRRRRRPHDDDGRGQQQAGRLSATGPGLARWLRLRTVSGVVGFVTARRFALGPAQPKSSRPGAPRGAGSTDCCAQVLAVIGQHVGDGQQQSGLLLWRGLHTKSREIVGDGQ